MQLLVQMLSRATDPTLGRAGQSRVSCGGKDSQRSLLRVGKGQGSGGGEEFTLPTLCLEGMVVIRSWMCSLSLISGELVVTASATQETGRVRFV